MGKPADMDAIFKGTAYGSVAQRLLAHKMDVNALRVNNTTLRKDEWKQLDETVVDISKVRLTGVSDLVSRGLVYNISNGLGTTVLESENISDMNDATMNMDGATRDPNDRVEYNIEYLPLPITHKDFQISIRVLEASRKLGQPLDTTQAGIAARKVAEKIETVLFTGASAYTFGGGTIRGYTDHASRNTGSLTANWDDSAAVAYSDVINMKQASIDAKHYGPWMLYVPTNFETALDEDYVATTSTTITVRERIKQIGGIIDVKVADKLTADNVVLVQMSPETVRMVIGMQPTTVEWDTEGGMISHFKVMSIMVPQIRADQDGNCGIVHFS